MESGTNKRIGGGVYGTSNRFVRPINNAPAVKGVAITSQSDSVVLLLSPFFVFMVKNGLDSLKYRPQVLYL